MDGRPADGAAGSDSPVVLLVARPSEFRDRLAALLTACDFRVWTAAGGVQAVLLAARAGERVRVVVADPDLPDLPGRTLPDRFRRRFPAVQARALADRRP